VGKHGGGKIKKEGGNKHGVQKIYESNLGKTPQKSESMKHNSLQLGQGQEGEVKSWDIVRCTKCKGGGAHGVLKGGAWIPPKSKILGKCCQNFQ